MSAACAWRARPRPPTDAGRHATPERARPGRPPLSMRVVDSRRLTGPSLLLDGPGAILDVELEGADPAAAIAGWRAELERLLDALGWSGAAIAARAHAAGLNLALAAPFDALYAATEVNEAAWTAARARLAGGASAAAPEPFADVVARL